jgi:TonB family protein
MKLLLQIVFFVFAINVFGVMAQSDFEKYCPETGEIEVRNFSERFESDQEFIAECETQTKLHQIEKFGKILPKVSGECEWSSNGCPVSLIKPSFPGLARTLKLSGQVVVKAIINEEGKVIRSKAIAGHSLFKRAAQKAACKSKFTPKTVCGRKVMQSRIIVYNFVK